MHLQHSKRCRDSLTVLLEELEQVSTSVLPATRIRSKSHLMSAETVAVEQLRFQKVCLEATEVFASRADRAAWVNRVRHATGSVANLLVSFVQLMCCAAGWTFGEIRVRRQGVGRGGALPLAVSAAASTGRGAAAGAAATAAATDPPGAAATGRSVILPTTNGAKDLALYRLAAGRTTYLAVPIFIRHRVAAVVSLLGTDHPADRTAAVSLAADLACVIVNCYGAPPEERGGKGGEHSAAAALRRRGRQPALAAGRRFVFGAAAAASGEGPGASRACPQHAPVPAAATIRGGAAAAAVAGAAAPAAAAAAPRHGRGHHACRWAPPPPAGPPTHAFGFCWPRGGPDRHHPQLKGDGGGFPGRGEIGGGGWAPRQALPHPAMGGGSTY